MDENTIAYKVIGAAINVHKEIGPGLLESAYHKAMMYELNLLNLNFESEVPVVFKYKDCLIQDAYRLDLLVEGKVIVELKAVEQKEKLSRAQLMTYLKSCDKRLGLILKFNTLSMKHGIMRVVNNL